MHATFVECLANSTVFMKTEITDRDKGHHFPVLSAEQNSSLDDFSAHLVHCRGKSDLARIP